MIEGSRRVGGLVETERTPDGFVLEHGADCLLTTNPAGFAAVRAVGLDREIVGGAGPRRTYVARGGGLMELPPFFGALDVRAVWAFARSPLLSLAGKVRAACEPIVPPRAAPDDESIHAFGVRRFGRAFTDAVLDPLLGGVYGADTTRLSMAACLPRLREFESAAGSVVVGMRRALRGRRARARAGERVLPPVVTLRDGMASLPVAAARGLGVEIGVTAFRLETAPRGFRVVTNKGTLACAGVVVATPAWRVPELVATIAPELASDVATIAHKRLDVVTLAWRRSEVPHPLDGTG